MKDSLSALRLSSLREGAVSALAGMRSWPLLCAFVLALSPGLAQPCADRDRDGYSASAGCTAEVDCNDADLDTHPGAAEVCDGVDNDCDGTLDEGCAGICSSWQRTIESSVFAEGRGGFIGAQKIDRARHGFGVAFWKVAEGGSKCKQVLFARIDDDGTPRGEPKVLRMGNDPYQTDPYLGIVWTGSEHLVAAPVAVSDDPDCEVPLEGFVHRATLFTLGPHGDLQRAPQVLSCAELSNVLLVIVRVVWTGNEAIVTWWERHSDTDTRVMAARITADGEVLDPCGVQLDLGESSYISSPDAAWGDGMLGVVYGNKADGASTNDIYFRGFSPDLVPATPERLRISQRPGILDKDPSLTWADGSWGVAWLSKSIDTATFDVTFARVSGDGGSVKPPGTVPVTTGAGPGQHDFDAPVIVWTGQEFLALYRDLEAPDEAIVLARVSSEGSVLENDVQFSRPVENIGTFPHGVWDGERLALAYRRSEFQDSELVVGFQGCVCPDADGDFVTTCLGDCDDGNPLVRPGLGQFEICADGWDNDCDGLTDCEDGGTCPPEGPIPAAVSGVVFLDQATLAWDPLPEASIYDVARGRLVDLRFEGDPRRTECVGEGHAANQLAVPELPVLSDGFLYLVRAWSGARSECRVGSWGSASRDETMSVCP